MLLYAWMKYIIYNPSQHSDPVLWHDIGYCTSGNIQSYETVMIRARGNVHPTPVHPAVLGGEFVHADDEEGSGGVVVQRETSIFLPLVVFFCPYQGAEGHIAIFVIAEVLSITLPAIFIFTSEVKCLAFHTGNNSWALYTEQSCQSEKNLVICVIM